MDLSSLKLNMNSPISILIGENGCGKSEILSQLARSSVDEFSSVIAIATSVYDKFPHRNFKKHYHYMGGRLGRFVPRIKGVRVNLNEKINRTAIARRQEQSALPIPALVAPPLPLPPLKFQLKMAYSWGK